MTTSDREWRLVTIAGLSVVGPEGVGKAGLGDVVLIT